MLPLPPWCLLPSKGADRTLRACAIWCHCSQGMLLLRFVQCGWVCWKSVPFVVVFSPQWSIFVCLANFKKHKKVFLVKSARGVAVTVCGPYPAGIHALVWLLVSKAKMLKRFFFSVARYCSVMSGTRCGFWVWVFSVPFHGGWLIFSPHTIHARRHSEQLLTSYNTPSLKGVLCSGVREVDCPPSNLCIPGTNDSPAPFVPTWPEKHTKFINMHPRVDCPLWVVCHPQ